MQYNVSIIIVNYNGKRYIDQLFDSFLTLQRGTLTFEVIFVDNHSIDDSANYLEKKYGSQMDNLKIVRSEKNLGFAGGNNLGVHHSSGEYIVFLNNDTRVEPNWLTELYECINIHGAGIVTSKLLFFYDYIKIQVKTNDKVIIKNNIVINGENYEIDPKFCRNMLVYEDHSVCFGHSYFYIPLFDGIESYKINITADNLGDALETASRIYLGQEYEFSEQIILSKEYVDQNRITLIQNVGSGIDTHYNGYDIGFCEEDQGQYDEIREVESTCGAAMIVKKEDFIKAGMFDETFFMYYEDTDLALRIKSQGKKLIYCPTANVRHIHTGSSKEWSPFFIFHVFRNRMLFILKNYPKSIFFKQFIKYFLQVGRSFISNQNKDIKKAKFRSLLSFIKHMPKYFKEYSKRNMIR